MIQRIQTIFLLLSSLCLAGLFALPLATSKVAGQSFLNDKVYSIMDSPILIIITALAILLPAIAIFLFNNRKLQVSLSRISGVSSILVLVAAVVLLMLNNLFNAENLQVGLGVVLVVLATIFSFLASRFIKKDDNLVKSMDRLR